METLLIALTPVLVAVLSQGGKKLVSKNLFTKGARKKVLRVGVAILSYGAVIGGAMLTGGEIDAVSTEAFATTLVTFLASSGTYFVVKK